MTKLGELKVRRDCQITSNEIDLLTTVVWNMVFSTMPVVFPSFLAAINVSLETQPFWLWHSSF
jgi:hypothetical protein